MKGGMQMSMTIIYTVARLVQSVSLNVQMKSKSLSIVPTVGRKKRWLDERISKRR